MRRCATLICCLAIAGCGTLQRHLASSSPAGGARLTSLDPERLAGQTSAPSIRTPLPGTHRAGTASPPAIAAQSPSTFDGRSRETPDADPAAGEFERLLAEELARSSPEEREQLRRQLARLDRRLAVLVLRNRRRLRELGRDALSGRRIDRATGRAAQSGGPGGYAIESAFPRATTSSVPELPADTLPESHTAREGHPVPDATARSEPFSDVLSAPDPRRRSRASGMPTDDTRSEPLRPVELLGIAPPDALPEPPSTGRPLQEPPADTRAVAGEASSVPRATPGLAPPREVFGPPPTMTAPESAPLPPREAPAPASTGPATPEPPPFADATPGESNRTSTPEAPDAAEPQQRSRWPNWVLNRARHMRPPALPAFPGLPAVEPRSVLRPLERPVAELAGLLGARETADAAQEPSAERVSEQQQPPDESSGNDSAALLRAWQDALARAEAALRAIPPEDGAAQRRRRIAAEVRLRLLALLANRPELAMTPIPGLSASEQEFWQKLLWGTANALAYTAAADQRKAELELLEAIASFEAAAGLLAEHAPLTLSNVTFCRRIESYGNYEPFSETVFRPGQPVLLYAELQHFRSEPTESGMMRSAIESAVEIRQADGTLVDRIDFPLTEDFCRHRRRDYFLSFQFTMPRTVQTLGPHVLVLFVRDELSGREATAQLRFTLE